MTPTSGGACSRSAGSSRCPPPNCGSRSHFIAVAAGLEDLGLSRLDAQTVSQTVLTELVENVAEHGNDSERPPVALVGAILLTAEVYARRQNSMHEHMNEIADHQFADRRRVLRMIVADSSADLAARLARRPHSREPALAPNGAAGKPS